MNARSVEDDRRWMQIKSISNDTTKTQSKFDAKVHTKNVISYLDHRKDSQQQNVIALIEF